MEVPRMTLLEAAQAAGLYHNGEWLIEEVKLGKIWLAGFEARQAEIDLLKLDNNILRLNLQDALADEGQDNDVPAQP